MTAIISAYNPAGAVAVREVYADAYGADPTGATDSTAAINRAIAALGTSAGNIVFSVGTYVWGTSSDLTQLIQNQGIVGQGSQVTNFTYKGNNQAINEFLSGVFDGSKQAGKFTGFTLSGFSAGGSAVGLQYGDLQGIFIDDVAINGFGKAGLYGKNVAGWSEQSTVRIRLTQNTAGYLFDTGSFDYSNYDLTVVANANQNGIQLQNNAQLQGVQLRMRGNFNMGVTNTGAVIAVAPAGGSDTSSIKTSFCDIAVETAATNTTGHFTIKNNTTSGASQLYLAGVVTFNNVAGNFQGTSFVTGQPLSVFGTMNDTVFGTMANGDAGVAVGAFDQNVNGNLTSPLFAGNIFVQAGDIQAFQLASGATTVSFQSVSTWGRRMDLFIKQPSSGAAGTITWPTGAGGVKWSGGVTPTLSSVNSRIDHIRLAFLPAENSWFGELIGTNYA